MSATHVDLRSIQEAAVRIAPFAHRTPVLTSRYFDQQSGGQVFFKCENFQRVGAFKFRGATNAVQSLSDAEAARGVVTHSSGNHAQALAAAAADRGLRATIVMPSYASAVKRAAVASYGAEIVDCGPTQQDREAACDEVMRRTGAVLVHPYDDPRIIAGQGTAALELLDEVRQLDVVLAPVGGGGLLSGTALAVTESCPGCQVWGAEPAAADDAHRSLASGRLIPVHDPATIADGLRTSLGEHTFPIIQQRVGAILTVSEAQIVEAMRLVWERMKIVIEPSAAVPVAALMAQREQFAERRIGIVLSGGNVDLARLPWPTAND